MPDENVEEQSSGKPVRPSEEPDELSTTAEAASEVPSASTPEPAAPAPEPDPAPAPEPVRPPEPPPVEVSYKPAAASPSQPPARPASPAPARSESSGGGGAGALKAIAILILLGLIGSQLYALFNNAGNNARPVAKQTPTAVATTPAATTSATTAATGSPTAATSPSATASPSATPPPQAYGQKAGTSLPNKATGTGWKIVGHVTGMYSLEVPDNWNAYATQQEGNLLAKQSQNAKLQLIAIPFNFIKDAETDIPAAESSFLGAPTLLGEKKMTLNGRTVYKRSYAISMKTGKELAETAWFVPEGSLCVAVILRGPTTEMKVSQDIFDHAMYSFKTPSALAPKTAERESATRIDPPGPGATTSPSPAASPSPSPTTTAAPATP